MKKRQRKKRINRIWKANDKAAVALLKKSKAAIEHALKLHQKAIHANMHGRRTKG